MIYFRGVIAKMRIVLERLREPKLAVKRIERECRRQLGGLLPLVKQLRVAKSPLFIEASVDNNKKLSLKMSMSNSLTFS